MTPKDKAKLDGIDWGANKYTLPIAAANKLGGVKSSTTGTASGRDYKVHINDDGTMKVNVPWEDTNTHFEGKLVAVGDTTAITNATNDVTDPYIGFVENSVRRDSVQIKGSGQVQVSAQDGVITVKGEATPLPPTLGIDNNTAGVSCSIKGPAPALANTSNYLRGDGTWGKELPDYDAGDKGKLLKLNDSGDRLTWEDKASLFKILSSDYNDSETGYLVKGAETNADNKHVLAGNGTWVLGLPPIDKTQDVGKTLKVGTDGNPYWE